MDVRPGGANLIVMRGPDGNEFPNAGVYLEVVKNERLVFTDAYTKAWEAHACGRCSNATSPATAAERLQHRVGVISQPVTHAGVFDACGHRPLHRKALVTLLEIGPGDLDAVA